MQAAIVEKMCQNEVISNLLLVQIQQIQIFDTQFISHK